MRTHTLLATTATATALMTGLLGTAPAAAAPGEEFVRGAVQNKQVSEQGRTNDTRSVSVHATEQAGEVSGQLNFRHVHQQATGSGDVRGLSEFRGSVDCLEVLAGTVRVSGTVVSGATRFGDDLTGKPYALEFRTDAGTFTLPAFGSALQPATGECATSGNRAVDITSGQLRTSS